VRVTIKYKDYLIEGPVRDHDGGDRRIHSTLPDQRGGAEELPSHGLTPGSAQLTHPKILRGLPPIGEAIVLLERSVGRLPRS